MVKIGSKQLIKELQSRLQEERQKTVKQIQILKAGDPFGDPDHAVDNAAVDTDVREQAGHQTIEAEIRDLNKRIQDIDHSLLKIPKGSYGRCEKCGVVIIEARLKLVPEARYCVSCEGKLRK